VVGDHQVAVYTADEDHPGERLPERYNHESTLSRTVSPGRNSFDFELRSQ